MNLGLYIGSTSINQAKFFRKIERSERCKFDIFFYHLIGSMRYLYIAHLHLILATSIIIMGWTRGIYRLQSTSCI